MKHIDARKLSSETQQHNRNQARRMFEKGRSRRVIANNLGVHYGTVCNWIRRYEQDGETGIAPGHEAVVQEKIASLLLPKRRNYSVLSVTSLHTN